MYRRYDPKSNFHPPKQGGSPPLGGANSEKQKTYPIHTPANHSIGQNCHPEKMPGTSSANKPLAKNPPPHKKFKNPQNPILGLIPSSIYNPETKKVLGFFSTEDLLLVALILVLLDSDSGDDSLLVYILLYVLLSEYIDLPF